MLEDVKIVLRDKLDVNLPLDDEGTTLVGDQPPYHWLHVHNTTFIIIINNTNDMLY